MDDQPTASADRAARSVIEMAASASDRALLERLETLSAGERRWPVGGAESWLVRVTIGLAAPVWLLVVIVAALTRGVRGRRPVVVVQDRVGYRRRRLLLPKIATMSVPSNTRLWGGLVELSPEAGVDPLPLAPVERWLRNSGLDELPQLALVVTGHMRIVGPRPATFGELEQLTRTGAVDTTTIGVDILAPGLVGVWQILDRHTYSLAERTLLDRFMIERWSPRLERTIVRIAARQALRRLFGRS